MIHKVKDLSPEQRFAIEGLLGRAVQEEEAVSVRALPTQSAPEWLRTSWDSARELGLDGLSMQEIDAEIRAGRQAQRR